MNHPSFLLASDKREAYTFLHRFDSKRHRFQGEYSLLHNRYSEEPVFLSKFLIWTQGEPLTLVASDSPSYSTIIANYRRFMEEEISDYVEEQVNREVYTRRNADLDKGLGQLQVMILKGMVEERLGDVQKGMKESGADLSSLGARELELNWMKQQILWLMERGNPRA